MRSHFPLRAPLISEVCGSAGAFARIHQKDFCQALGVYPALKYEEDGGPTIADVVRLVERTSSSSNCAQDRRELADRVAFKSSVAVKYGTERKYRQISGRNIARAADVLGLKRELIERNINEMTPRLQEVFEAALADVPVRRELGHRSMSGASVCIDRGLD